LDYGLGKCLKLELKAVVMNIQPGTNIGGMLLEVEWSGKAGRIAQARIPKVDQNGGRTLLRFWVKENS